MPFWCQLRLTRSRLRVAVVRWLPNDQATGNGGGLPGLEGRAHEQGMEALATGADGRDALRQAASEGIQRGENA